MCCTTLVLYLVLACNPPIPSTPAAPAAGEGATPTIVPVPSPATAPTAGATYYVRTDGGNGEQCTCLVDAPYPGSGTDQPGAWDHPFRALQPSGEYGQPGVVRISSGAILLIAPGSYRIGYGAPGAENCQPDYPWDCVMPPIPGGPDPAQPTRILGKGWDSGCPDPPELWGTEGAAYILAVTGGQNVEIACLELTDHATCADAHTGGLACNVESFPYGDWAMNGLYAVDAANVTLRDLDIHGLAHTGVWAGRLSGWTKDNAGNQIKTNGPTVIENSVIVGNCGYFEGKPFTYHVDNCRAYGNAISLNLRPGNALTVVNNTLTSEGDCLVEVVCEGSCTGTESVRMRNNIFLGQTDFLQPFEETCFVYWENFPADPVDTDHAILRNVKENPCPVGGHDICQAPGLVGETLAAFDTHLRLGSPTIDTGSAADAPADDFDGRPRDTRPDIGACEFWQASSWIYLLLVVKSS